MTPRKTPTIRADAATAAARRRAAIDHWDAAEDLAAHGHAASSVVSLYVLAGIAAADAICCAKLGEFSQSSNHADAVAVLRRAQPELASSLQRLLTRKTEANYGVVPLGAGRVADARAAANRLVDAARIA